MSIPTVYDQKGATPGTLLKNVGNFVTNPVGAIGSAIGKSVANTVGNAVQGGANAVAGLISPPPKVVAPAIQSPSSYPNGLLTPKVPATPAIPSITQTPASPAMPTMASNTQNSNPFTSQSNTGFINPQPVANNNPVTTQPPAPQAPSAFNTNVNTLTNFGSGQETPGVAKAREDLKNFQTQYAQQTGANSAAPIPLEFSQGRNQVLANQYNAALPAYQGAVTNSLTSQGQQIGAANQAGTLAQPVGQFGLLTNPQTGQPLNTGVFQSAIQQAQQLVNSGTPVNDPSVQALLSPFGFVGPLAFNQAMQSSQGGGWNPAAQSAVTNQNITQGVDTQQQAYSLNLGLQQLKTVQPLIQNFLKTSGINPTDVPAMNAQIGTYIANLKNPAATAQYQYMVNDLQKFASQMLSAGAGGTPTGIQAATELMNPQNLSMSQIQYALNTLDTLGTNQVAVLQQQSKASLGNQPSQYAGNPAAVSNNIPIAPDNPAAAGVKSNIFVEGGAGAGMNIFSTLTSFPALIGGLLGHIFN